MPLSLSERPTAPPVRASPLSQRPTAAPPGSPFAAPFFSPFAKEESPIWPEEGASRQTKRSAERDAVRPSRPGDPFRDVSAPPSTQGVIPLRKVTPPPSVLHGERLREKAAPVSPRRPATEILGSRIAPESARPFSKRIQTGRIQVLMTPEQILALPLDHKAGFLLSMLGTVSTLDELLDISGMPRNDAMRLLCDLADFGAIDLG